ncbi:MAG: hypothetical protein GPJ54_21090, partial [Candidatus Heimdallarchaeota archaeon]|nr:hypothetical protein [Candidatus Heimdallarchaeota archaeon]
MRLGRFPKLDMVIKNTPKAGSRKRKGSPHTVNKKVAIFYSCIRRNELLVRLSNLDGCSRMILRWLKSMKIPSWSGLLTRINQVEGS